MTSDNKISRSGLYLEKIKNHVMKTKYLSILLLMLSLISVSSFAQTENEDPLLGLPGDDLDLYAVLDLFQKSKTIEDFEKSLNDTKAGLVNLDLNNDGKVDFIKVETKKDGEDFLFILQNPISEKETQDVAVIAVSKDDAGKVSMQIIGDEKLYGKDYVVEPKTKATEAVTSNPGYVGDDPVTVNVAATTEVVVVQSAPIVQYVYSPVYVPYYPPYYYGYYPHYWAPIAIISIGIYRRNHYYHHSHYHGGRGNTNIHIHNHNSYNNYHNNGRNSSRKVDNNIKNGNFKTAGQGGSRPSSGQRGSGPSSGQRGSGPSGTQTGRTTNGSTANRSSTTKRAPTSNRSASPSTSNRSASPTPSTSNRSSASRSMGSSRSSSSASRSSAGRSTASRGGGGRRRH